MWVSFPKHENNKIISEAYEAAREMEFSNKHLNILIFICFFTNLI